MFPRIPVLIVIHLLVGPWPVHANEDVECGSYSNVALTSQAAVLQLARSGCDTLGTLTVSGEVSDLSPLSAKLRVLAGALSVTDTPALAGLSGLEGLTSVGSDEAGVSLLFDNNSALRSLSSLRNLRGVLPGGLRASLNPLLTSFEGLKGVESTRYLYVCDNEHLASFDGLEGLTRISGSSPDAESLMIQGNPHLGNISALHQVTGTIQTTVRIWGNLRLTSMDGLQGVTWIQANLWIVRNAQMNSVAALGNLTGVGFEVWIEGNPGLISLHGLHNLEACLHMKINYHLGLKSFDAFGKLHELHRLQIWSNPYLLTLNGFDSLERLGPPDHYLWESPSSISDNKALRSLSGLGSLTGRQTAVLEVRRNEALISLHGLDGVTFWPALFIKGNPSLESVSALGSLMPKWPMPGTFDIEANDRLLSAQGLQGIRTQVNGLTFQLAADQRLCFPTWDVLKNDKNDLIDQIWPSWNESLCHECAKGCGHPDSDFIECDYQAGLCRCPLGFMGPECGDPMPRLRVDGPQDVRCGRSQSGASSCIVGVRVCLEGPSTAGPPPETTPLRLFDSCEGSAKSTGGAACLDGSDFELPTEPGRWEWEVNASCGRFISAITVQSGGVIEPTKYLSLRLGYSSRLQPAFLLEGIVAHPRASPAPLLYPYCLEAGDCSQYSPEPISVQIEGRDLSCHLRDRWHSVDPSTLECQLVWQAPLGLLLGSALLAIGLRGISSRLQISWAPLRVVARRMLIEDISTEKCMVILTATRPHRLRSFHGRPFPVVLEDTCHPGLTSVALRAQALDSHRLRLLRESGSPLKGQFDTSRGTVRLPLMRVWLNTGWLLPTGLTMPSFILVGSASLLATAAHYEVGDVAATLAAAAVVLALASPGFWGGRSGSSTALERQLAQYTASLLKERPPRKPCSRGPGRAVQLHLILDFCDFFAAFVRDRSMYYVESNIIRPLTAAARLSFAEVVGPSSVDWFVSHYWGHPFSQTCNALRKHAQSCTAPGEEWTSIAYWVCTLSNNQYDIEVELGDGRWDASSFYLALCSPTCLGVCMVLDELAAPLSRSWCLFEVFQTLRRSEAGDAGFQGLLFCTSAGTLDHGEASLEVTLNLGKRITEIRLQDAQATSAEDKRMIDGLVIAEMGSFEVINAKLKHHFGSALDAAKRSTLREFDRIAVDLV